MKKLAALHNPKVVTDLRQMVRTGAEVFGDKDIYIYKENKEEKHLSYKQNYERMNQFGTALSLLGIMGTHVAVIGETHPSYMTTFFAVINGGGVIVPLDKDLMDEELIDFINISEVDAIVYTSAFNKRLTKFADKIPAVKYFIPIMEEGEDCDGERVIGFNTLLKSGQEALDKGDDSFTSYDINTEDLAAILFTSGTTGTSKGVMLSHRNFVAATNASCQSMQYDDRNVFVDCLPMHHSYEITCGQLAIQNLGATLCINDSLKNVMRNFERYKPNALMLVPLFVETMYKRIWSEIDKKGMRKKVRFAMNLSNTLLKCGIDIRDKMFGQITGAFGGRLNSIVCGGAPIAPQLIKDFNSFGIFVLEGYGITECSPLVAVNSPGKERYHSVGQPVKGCQVKIDMTPGEKTGEILVKGENVMMGYYKNEEATKEVFTDDGWFRTGDIGYMDNDNYIFITGRKKNVIILSNGKNIFPEELEEYLSKCESIDESVVIGRKHENGEIVITAVVYPNQDKVASLSKDDAEKLVKDEISALNKQLPLYKQIRDVEIRDTEFEKTTSKKIKRYKVN